MILLYFLSNECSLNENKRLKNILKTALKTHQCSAEIFALETLLHGFLSSQSLTSTCTWISIICYWWTSRAIKRVSNNPCWSFSNSWLKLVAVKRLLYWSVASGLKRYPMSLYLSRICGMRTQACQTESNKDSVNCNLSHDKELFIEASSDYSGWRGGVSVKGVKSW